tara:strand:+ start:542 stop:1309 length:768 start_codon:yes stop_codon:yes gene_type:complete
MNFFFGINTHKFNSIIKIPTFQNSGKYKKNYNLYFLNISNNHWKIELYSDKDYDEFFIVKEDFSNNENIFFLASEEEVKKFKNSNLNLIDEFNNFTNTKPAFRSNLEVNMKDGGFSSYQSEYPLNMIKKNGSIVSSLNILSNKHADNNYLIFKNIYYKPYQNNFDGYFINFNKKKIVKKFNLKTNFTNLIEINKEYLNEDHYFFTVGYIGIPIYLSIKNNHLSLEHTHPPHEYILSNNKFKKISELKKEFNEIIT